MAFLARLMNPCRPRAALSVIAFLCAAASAHAQGRPDIVWMRGGHTPYGSVGLGYTPDASRVVSLGFDGTIKVFRTSDGTLERTIPAFSQRGKALALSPDGVTIAATGSDWIDYFTGKDFGALRLWRLSDGALIRTITTTQAIQSPSALAFSPDGQTLAIDGSVGVRLWRVSDGVLLRTIVNPHSPANATPDLIGVVFSRDGQSLATQANDLMQLRVSDGTLLRSYGSYTGCGNSPALSPDGALLANCSGVYRTADGVKVSPLLSQADFMSFSPDGSKLAAGSSAAGPVRIWSTANWALLHDYSGHGSSDGIFHTVMVAFSPNSQALASSRYEIHELRASDAALLQKITAYKSIVSAVAVSRDGRIIAGGTQDQVTGKGAVVSLWRASDGALLRTFDVASNVLDAAFSPDGVIIATTSVDGIVKFWNVSDGSFLRAVNLGRLQNFSVVRFFPDGQTVAVLSDGGFSNSDIVILRVSDGSTVRTLKIPQRSYGMGMSPDGRTLAATGAIPPAGSGGGTFFRSQPAVFLFVDNETTPSKTITGPVVTTNILYSVAFSNDGSTIAAAGSGLGSTNGVSGGSLWIWRAADSSLIAQLPLPRQMRSVSFSTDGASLIVGGDDGLRVFRASDWSLRQYFDQEVGPAFTLSLKVSSVASIPGTSRLVYGRTDASLVVANLTSTQTCNLTPNPGRFSFPATASTGSLAVSAVGGCPWTAESDAPWLTITSGASGSGNGTVSFALTATTGAASRLGHLTIGGQSVVIAQAGLFCTFQLSKTGESVGPGGGTSSFDVTAPNGCSWTSSSSVDWLVISDLNAKAAWDTIKESTSGNGTLQFTVFANPTSTARSTTLNVAGQTFSITQSAGCTYAISPLAATGQPGGGSGTVAVTTSGAGCPWTARSNASWITVSSGASGSTNGTVTYSAAANTGPTRSGTLTIAGFTHTVTQAPLTPAPAFGIIDTPLNNTTGLSGSIPVTGWALDDVRVTAIRILRDPVAGETPGQLVFLGNAVRVNGARPDVAAGNAAYPENTKAGWGYLLLSNMLPGRGNGAFRLSVYADDQDGHSTLLGTRTITCDNANATTPFGGIDTPAQGETVSGSVNNFGWVLSPGARRADGAGGGTVNVVIDGAIAGAPAGWVPRADLTALFPVAQFAGVPFALAVHTFDTTTLTDGVHTIAWVVTDNQGGAAGIGSRYFTVANAAGQTSSASASPLFSAMTASIAEVTEITGRHGFDAAQPLEIYTPDTSGVFVVHAEELEPIELHVPGLTGGYLTYNAERTPLPIGSRIDAAAGLFTWMPGVAFVGTYELALERKDGTAQTVRVVLHPKGTFSTAQIVIDTPSATSDVTGDFTVAGWAIDPTAATGTGIDAIHVWAYPSHGGAPVFLGAATLRGERPDVAAQFGGRFLRSGYGLTVKMLPPGDYTIAVFARRASTGEFLPARSVQVRLTADSGDRIVSEFGAVRRTLSKQAFSARPIPDESRR